MKLSRRGLFGLFAGAAAAPLLAKVLPKAIPTPVPVPLVNRIEKLAVGDLFTISGVYSINPQNLEETSLLKQFVAVGGGSGSFFPHPISRGPYQNVSRLPVDDDLIIPLGGG